MFRYFCKAYQYGSFGTLYNDEDRRHEMPMFVRPFLSSPCIFPQVEGIKCAIDALEYREPGQPYISVTVLSAKNLSLGDGASFSFMASLHYLFCSVWLTPLECPTQKTTKQPKTDNPTFRDTLTFPLIFTTAETRRFKNAREPSTNAELLARIMGLTLHLNLYINKPMTLSSDSNELVGTLKVKLNSFTFTSVPSEIVSDWFVLSDASEEVMKNSNAAIRLKLQILT